MGRESTVIVVLGMHRSGTSFLTGSLQEAGVFLGEISEQNPHNARGNRENLEFRRLNEEVLEWSLGRWHDPPYRVIWTERHARRRDELIDRFAGQSLWGFKDPRTLFTLEFWREGLPDMRHVGIFRHPMKVARSLHARDRLPLPRGLRLWMKYNSRLLEIHRDAPFPLLDFDLPGPELEEAVRSALGKLGAGIPAAPLRFFDDRLRHQAPGQTALPPACARLHQLLQERTG